MPRLTQALRVRVFCFFLLSVGLIAVAAPVASACTSTARVSYFSGTASVSRNFSVSGEYEPDGSSQLIGTSTVSLDEGATGLQMKKLKPTPHGKTIAGLPTARGFSGKTSGGQIKVDDTWVDQTEVAETASAEQVAAGPTRSGPLGQAGAGVAFSVPGTKVPGPYACKYAIAVGYEILSQVHTSDLSGGVSLPVPADDDLGFIAQTPAEHIPASLHLHGTGQGPGRRHRALLRQLHADRRRLGIAAVLPGRRAGRQSRHRDRHLEPGPSLWRRR
ncbi:MAG: hypothetical protein QM729_05660 [Solirubrobacterales bacterium]